MSTTEKRNARQYLEGLREIEAAIEDLERSANRWRSARGDLELLYYLEDAVDELPGPQDIARSQSEIDRLFCELYDRGLEFPDREDQYRYDLEAVTELVEEVRRERP